MNKWLSTHIRDCETIVKKPVIFAEYGPKWSHAPGYTERGRRDALSLMFNAVHDNAQVGGPAGGALVWLFVTNATRGDFDDGYGIVPGEDSAIDSLFQHQGGRLAMLHSWSQFHPTTV